MAAGMAVTYKIDLVAVEELVAGIVEGFIKKDDLMEIEQCLENGDRLEAKVEQIIEDLPTLNISKIIDAIKVMADIVEELPQDLEDCKNISGDLHKITDWAQSIDFSKIPGNTLQHLTEIAADVQKQVADWQTGNYYEVGETVTDILFLVLGAPEYRQSPEDATVGLF